MTAFTFTIDVQEDRVSELENFLKDLGINFQPENQMTAFNVLNLETSVAMGENTSTIIQEINWLLNAEGLAPLIPTDHAQWNLARRWAFLKFAVKEFAWARTTADYCFWLADGKTWDEVVQENPLVFTGRDE